MYFSDADKQIYTSPDDRRFDPLAVHRKLVVVTGAKINDYLADWNGPDLVAKAVAEERLALASRSAFGYLPFDQDGGVTDAVALETLFHFLHYCQGK